MNIPGFHGTHLTYCLNIHPGETWDENAEAIRRHAARVKERVSPREPFGLGLRLSRRAVDTLEDPAHLRDLQQMLAEGGMYVFTINGFPYGAFHGTTIKSDVYRPDWRQPERLEYTCRLGALLAAVLPEGVEGSISTVPVSYREWMRDDRDFRVAAENLAACAATFHALRERTGREIHLGLEPEPDCALETTADTVAFFEQHLRPIGAEWLQKHRGASPQHAEEILQRHVGVCFDTCHISVQFESLENSLATLLRRGIRISKVQISAAIKTRVGVDSARRLEAFVDPVYLHQVKIRDTQGQLSSHPDLTRESIAGWTDASDTGECRVHFHVPLYVESHDGIGSTVSDVTPAFFQQATQAGARHFEIETYTFDVLPAAMRAQGIEQSIAREYAWVFTQFEHARRLGISYGAPV